MLLKAIPASGSLMSPLCHQGRKGPSCLCSRASRLVGHRSALLVSSPSSPAGAGMALSPSLQNLHDFPSLWHKVIKGQSYH